MNSRISIPFLLCSMFLCAQLGYAQSIVIDSVSSNSFCAGDPIAVSFTVSGSWDHDNAFTLQLSDSAGSFSSSFTRLGSVVDTAPGTFTVISTIPLKTTYSDHYRVRVIGAYPFVSTISGSDIEIGAYPLKYSWVQLPAVALSVPARFHLDHDPFGHEDGVADRVDVDFGADATPRTFTYTKPGILDYFTITYSTTGVKTLISRTINQGGCSVSDTARIYVYDCTTPQVPHNAIIVSNDYTVATHNKTYWINPGVSFSANFNDTVFAEAGASIQGVPGSNSQIGNVVYLKPGATSNIVYSGIVIHAPGAGVDKSDEPNAPTLECSNLSFDYSVAPPNSIMHINDGSSGVKDGQLTQIDISPNPTSGVIALSGIPANATITAINILGETMCEAKAQGDQMLNLSQFPAGTYYIRIASNNIVTTKTVVKK